MSLLIKLLSAFLAFVALLPAGDTSSYAIAPAWSMEPWFWEDDVNTAAVVEDLINGCREHDLPLGAVLLDSPWATAYNNFVFDEKRYPNPRRMIQTWRGKGIRTVLWMTNMINTREGKSDASGGDEDLYAIGKARGYFVNHGEVLRWWKGSGALIDYTNPEAVAWWHRIMDRALSLGIDGWKVDGTEKRFYSTKRETSRGVLDPREYSELYYRDTLNYSRRYKPDFVTMSRSVDIANSRDDLPHAPFDAGPITWVGDQRHSWTGKGLDEAARSSFRALELGYPLVGSDAGGYQTDPNHRKSMPRLLYLRWAQWNALTPFFLNGGHDEHRPWKFDQPFFETFRRYMWLHHELIPFFYSQAVQANVREGELMHLGPGYREFQLGDALLVGLMMDEKPEREIAFPEGVWLDYWDNRVQHRGGETVRVAVPEQRSPIYVRLGAILALNVENDAVQHGSATSKGWRTLDIYPSAKPSSAVLWDTAPFPPQVERDRSVVSCTPKEGSLVIRLEGGPVKDTILRVWSPGGAKSVKRDGKPLRAARARGAWEKSQAGWWYDATDQRLWVRVAKARDTTVEIAP